VADIFTTFRFLNFLGFNVKEVTEKGAIEFLIITIKIFPLLSPKSHKHFFKFIIHFIFSTLKKEAAAERYMGVASERKGHTSKPKRK
jgi:hypothetical protein